MDIEHFRTTLNSWGQARVPFLFITDFELANAEAWKLSEVDSEQVLFSINGFTNVGTRKGGQLFRFAKMPESFEVYKPKFDGVYDRLAYGDSFLTNLTCRTKIDLSISLRDLFFEVQAPYLLCYRDFVVFSPETFVRINNQKIYSYPMKGTIDASLPEARERILSDEKEIAEHVTIVDLIRNDLSIVSHNVTVSRFRYVEEIKTNDKHLLQVSSEVQGDLPDDYLSRLGDILLSLLPAGSVSGAPKDKTLEIIAEVEQGKRGYYTGVFGYFDGKDLDSGVMIRYIEKDGNDFYYRSGGGITTQSRAEDEYHEMIDKIYVPVY